MATNNFELPSCPSAGFQNPFVCGAHPRPPATPGFSPFSAIALCPLHPLKTLSPKSFHIHPQSACPLDIPLLLPHVFILDPCKPGISRRSLIADVPFPSSLWTRNHSLPQLAGTGPIQAHHIRSVAVHPTPFFPPKPWNRNAAFASALFGSTLGSCR